MNGEDWGLVQAARATRRHAMFSGSLRVGCVEKVAAVPVLHGGRRHGFAATVAVATLLGLGSLRMTGKKALPGVVGAFLRALGTMVCKVAR